MIETLLTLAFQEDLGSGDLTTEAIFKGHSPTVVARIVAKESGILSGLAFAEAAFARVDSSLRCKALCPDGQSVADGQTIVEIGGSAASILKAERVALNGLQYLSGIATITAAYVAQVKGTGAEIYDTRKILAPWRELAKAAVRHGGGKNHRMGLFDRFLIKENHIFAGEISRAGAGIRAAIAACRRHRPDIFLEVEVRTLAELEAALAENPDAILLDNFPITDLRKAVRLGSGRSLLEASGGVTLGTVRDIAETGVERISVGALTHSPKALDLSLLFEKN